MSLETISLSITTATDVVNGGAMRFELNEKQLKYLKAFGLLGCVVKDIIGLCKPKPPGMAMYFNRIETKLTQMGREVKQSIQELGSLIVEHSFTTDIIIKVDKLEYMMADIMRSSSKSSFDEFANECRQNTPKSLILDIRGRLANASTNPLTKAMEADELKTSRTFNVWKNTIETLLCRLVALQEFHIGTVYSGNDYVKAEEELMRTCRDVRAQFKKFIRDYESNYWPNTVQQLVERTMDNNTNKENVEKAEIIRDTLKQIHTEDQFYIIVYNHCGGFDKHCFRWNGGQTICVFRRGGCNVIVYRSRNMHLFDDAYFRKFSTFVEEFRHKNYTRDDSGLRNACRDAMEQFSDCGMVALIMNDQNIAIRSTGPWEWGPGWWITTQVWVTDVDGYGSGLFTHARLAKRKADVRFIAGFH